MNENGSENLEELFHAVLSGAIASAIDDRMLLSRWVLVFETLEEDGKSVSLLHSPDTETWEVLGMASAATELLKGEIGFRPVEDEEDE